MFFSAATYRIRLEHTGILIMTVFQLLMVSCNITKKLNKESVITSSQSVVTSTITEQLDTAVTIHPDSLQGSLSMTDLFRGNMLYESNGSEILQMHYDPLTKRVVAKAIRKKVVVPVQIHKTTITQARTSTQSSRKTVTKDKQIVAGLKTANLWLILAIMALILAWYLAAIFKKKKTGEQT